jgi:hypothetical protein
MMGGEEGRACQIETAEAERAFSGREAQADEFALVHANFCQDTSADEADILDATRVSDEEE